jgi:hypothetical protein
LLGTRLLPVPVPLLLLGTRLLLVPVLLLLLGTRLLLALLLRLLSILFISAFLLLCANRSSDPEKQEQNRRAGKSDSIHRSTPNHAY